jgi:hypothetical protein
MKIMEKLKTQSKKFNVGDVVVDRTTHEVFKILDFPEWFIPGPEQSLNQKNSYYLRWIHIDYNLNVSYGEEIRYNKNVDSCCDKIEYITTNY